MLAKLSDTELVPPPDRIHPPCPIWPHVEPGKGLGEHRFGLFPDLAGDDGLVDPGVSALSDQLDVELAVVMTIAVVQNVLHS